MSSVNNLIYFLTIHGRGSIGAWYLQEAVDLHNDGGLTTVIDVKGTPHSP